MDSRELNRAMERVESARSRQAVEFDKLFDSIVLRGVLFYRPTLAHSWTMAELLERGRSWSSVERRLVLGWCLTFSPVEVGVFPGVASGRGGTASGAGRRFHVGAWAQRL